MKPQFEKNIVQFHPFDLLDEPLERHITTIKHKAALLQKMLQYMPSTVNFLYGFRNLKIQPFYAPRDKGHSYLQVPRILLQGKWLRKIGFEIDDYARIIALPKLLIITSSNPEMRQFHEPARTRTVWFGPYCNTITLSKR